MKEKNSDNVNSENLPMPRTTHKALKRGMGFFQLRARLTGNLNTEDAQGILAEVFQPGKNPVMYNFKHFSAPEGDGFDFNPRLIREEIEVRPKSMEFGEAEVELQSSDYDPWAEVEISRILGAVYTIGDNSMLKASVVGEADPVAFAPYAFAKWDQ